MGHPKLRRKLRRKLRPNHKSFCDGCVWFFYPVEKLGAMCLATVRFIDSPINPRVDLKGVEDPFERNKHNACDHRQSVSRVAWKTKKWMLENIENGPKKEPTRKQKPEQEITEQETIQPEQEVEESYGEIPEDEVVIELETTDEKDSIEQSEESSTDEET